MTFLSGVNLFFLGVIGEYVGRVYEETKGRPHYVIGRVVRQRGAPGNGDTVLGELRENWEDSRHVAMP
jgi:hypothetical protein